MRAEELIRALDYMEEHLEGELRVPDIASDCYVSVSSLQKSFRYAFGISINDYILRRRFSRAAKDLLETDDGILEISLKYGYANAESFTRGFRRIWGINPGEYRKSRRFTGHTPKFALRETQTNKEDQAMISSKYDLTEMYDIIRGRKNNAYVCADLNGLMWINDNLGFDAGDAALREMIRRLEEACAENDVLLRIGGDEFVIFTAEPGMDHANDIVSKVAAQNEKKIAFGDAEFAVNIHVGAFRRAGDAPADAEKLVSEISEQIRTIHN
ncbi:MAG: helix-turn-helix domain-containing protein [Clostridia bacterium]|nr:helix-turn-helix domain-containing protein [Clostridia bacterium]